MLCQKPIGVGGSYFPCGQCEPCRINRRRVWAHRIMLETTQHQVSSFLTLTYDDASLPHSASGLSSLAPEDARNWLKRIRKAVAPIRLRYYLVGEYGDDSFRPHYHVGLFGYGTCANGITLRMRNRPMADQCCACCRLVATTWQQGDVDVRTLDESRSKYLGGYIEKKMTRFDDPRLGDRHPEFARMSLKPGIGQLAMHDIADVILRLGLDSSEADVPSALRHGKKMLPLGRYLRQQLRLMIGKEIHAPDEVLKEAAARLLPMRLAAHSDSENPSVKAQIVKAFAQDVLNRSKRQRIFSQRRYL